MFRLQGHWYYEILDRGDDDVEVDVGDGGIRSDVAVDDRLQGGHALAEEEQAKVVSPRYAETIGEVRATLEHLQYAAGL